MADFGDSTPLVVSGAHSEALTRETAHGQDERWLQSLIHRHPMCLPMGEIEPAFVGLLPVCMELPVSNGWVDNLLMTPDGNITIVEVKLWQNPEARRAVVAQALEYATGLFRMTYDDLQSAVMRGIFGDGERPAKLYDLFRGYPDALPEGAFVDTVSRNLKMGRIVVLVAGDGIRQDAQDLVAGLQAHANFHFTFALVEMPVFSRETETDQTDELIVVPRTLLKTTMIERVTIRVQGDQVEVKDVLSTAGRKPRGIGITEEQFWDAIESGFGPESRRKLEEFAESLGDLAVEPAVKKTLRLRWPMPDGRKLNLGYIMKDGAIYTEQVGEMTTDELALRYNEELARTWGGKVVSGKRGRVWVGRGDDRAFRVDEIEGKYEGWRDAIRELLDQLTAPS